MNLERAFAHNPEETKNRAMTISWIIGAEGVVMAESGATCRSGWNSSEGIRHAGSIETIPGIPARHAQRFQTVQELPADGNGRA